MTAPILITGATGFVGRAVAENLVARGLPIRLVLRKGSSTKLNSSLSQLEIVETKDAFSEDYSWWAHTCAGARMVINLAWYVNPVDYLNSEKNLNCLTGTLEMVRGASTAGVTRIVGVGTCFEYDLGRGDLDALKTPLAPLTLYAASKVAAFQCLERWLEAKDIEFLWARIFYLHGTGEPATRLVPFLNSHLAAGREVPLSSGNQIRDFMDVDDAAALLTRAALSKTTGAFNICSGKGVTVRELAERIADEYGRRDLLRFGARPDKLVDPPRVVGIPTAIDDG